MMGSVGDVVPISQNDKSLWSKIHGAKWLYDKKIAFLMAWHYRLGKDALISKYVNKDIARAICNVYITIENQCCNTGGGGSETKIYKYNTLDDFDLVLTPNGSHNNNCKYRVTKYGPSLSRNSGLFFQTPLLSIYNTFIANGNPQELLMCNEFGTGHHDSKFIDGLYHDISKKLLSAFKQINTKNRITVHIKMLSPTEQNGSKGANLGLMLSHQQLYNQNTKIRDIDDNIVVFNNIYNVVPQGHEKNKNKNINNNILSGLFKNGTILKAIMSLGDITSRKYAPNHIEYNLWMKVHRIKIYGSCDNGLFDISRFTIEDKYELYKESIYKGPPNRYSHILVPYKDESLSSVFTPILYQDRLKPTIYIQTPMMNIAFDVDKKYHDTDMKCKSICLMFDDGVCDDDTYNIDMMRGDSDNIKNQRKFYDDLVDLDKQLALRHTDRRIILYPLLKRDKKLQYNPYIKISGKIWDRTQLDNIEFKCYDANGVECTWSNTLPHLVRGCRVRAIYHYCNTFGTISGTHQYVPVKLDQLQFFIQKNTKDLNEYAFYDTSSDNE